MDRLRPQQTRPATYVEAEKAVADLLAAEAHEASLGNSPDDASDEEQEGAASSGAGAGHVSVQCTVLSTLGDA